MKAKAPTRECDGTVIPGYLRSQSREGVIRPPESAMVIPGAQSCYTSIWTSPPKMGKERKEKTKEKFISHCFTPLLYAGYIYINWSVMNQYMLVIEASSVSQFGMISNWYILLLS